jgi:hypothetical protein
MTCLWPFDDLDMVPSMLTGMTIDPIPLMIA